MRKSMVLFLIVATLLGIWYFGLGGATAVEGVLHEETIKFIRLVIFIAGLFIVYFIVSILLQSAMLKAEAKEGEITMIHGVLKSAFILLGLISILSEWFSLGTMGAIFAAFGGMFLGWSLQGPVSGFAGWFLISVIRPFSVGDRVQLPSYGLVGDVMSVSQLYTILNQVGGSVGSEEPANRTILIPNAMLFSTLVINYTPKNQEKLIAQFQKRFEKREATSKSAYMLDEFVLRLTFDSDWDEAERILLNAAKEVTADIIRETGQQPYIRADVPDWYGVHMRLRFMTIATERPRIIYELTKRIHKEVKASDKVDIAIPYVYSFKKPFHVRQFTEQMDKPLPPNPDEEDARRHDSQTDAPKRKTS